MTPRTPVTVAPANPSVLPTGHATVAGHVDIYTGAGRLNRHEVLPPDDLVHAFARTVGESPLPGT